MANRFKKSVLPLDDILNIDVADAINTGKADVVNTSESEDTDITTTVKPNEASTIPSPSKSKSKQKTRLPEANAFEIKRSNSVSPERKINLRMRVHYPISGVNSHYDKLAAHSGDTKALGHLITKAFEHFENTKNEVVQLPDEREYRGTNDVLITARKFSEIHYGRLKELVDPFGIETETMVGTKIARTLILNYLPHFRI